VLLACIPPTRAAAKRTTSGFSSAKNLFVAAWFRKSNSRLDFTTHFTQNRRANHTSMACHIDRFVCQVVHREPNALLQRGIGLFKDRLNLKSKTLKFVTLQPSEGNSHEKRKKTRKGGMRLIDIFPLVFLCFLWPFSLSPLKCY